MYQGKCGSTVSGSIIEDILKDSCTSEVRRAVATRRMESGSLESWDISGMSSLSRVGQTFPRLNGRLANYGWIKGLELDGANVDNRERAGEQNDAREYPSLYPREWTHTPDNTIEVPGAKFLAPLQPLRGHPILILRHSHCGLVTMMTERNSQRRVGRVRGSYRCNSLAFLEFIHIYPPLHMAPHTES